MSDINKILAIQYQRSLSRLETARHTAERMRENNKLQAGDIKNILHMFKNGSRPNHIAKKLGLTKELVDGCIREYMKQEEDKYNHETAAKNATAAN